MKTSYPLLWRAWHPVRKCLYDVIQIHNGLPVILCKVMEDSPLSPAMRDQIMMSPQEAQFLRILQATPFTDVTSRPIYEYDILACQDRQQGLVMFMHGCPVLMANHLGEDAIQPEIIPLGEISAGARIIGHNHNYVDLS